MGVGKGAKRTAVNPSDIRNKVRRREVHEKQKATKAKDKVERRRRREKEVEELGEDAPPKQTPRTIENTREADETVVEVGDEEVMMDEAGDEFAAFWDNEKASKVMITTRPRPSKELFLFISDLMSCIPNSFYYPRKTYTVQQISEWAGNKDFTHLFVLSEKNKKCNGIIMSVLPEGPTAFFKVSNVVPSTDISGAGNSTSHTPELVLNNFNTRLGHRVGRFLGSVFPHEPEFRGRQVVTFHNQRDYIFVRRHRYIFRGGKGEASSSSSSSTKKKKKDDDKPVKMKGTRTALQELGPRFTLKLRWLQMGSFDTQFGEYEWIHKRKEMDTTRRTFHL